jgi:hypothetical protein
MNTSYGTVFYDFPGHSQFAVRVSLLRSTILVALNSPHFCQFHCGYLCSATMSMDADPVIEVVDAPTKRRSRRETVPLTRLYLTSLPAYEPKHRYDLLPFATEENGNSKKEPMEDRIAKVRTFYCLTISLFWTLLFYAIVITAIPAFFLLVIAAYQKYIDTAKTPNMSNMTNTSDMFPNPFP